MNAIVERLAKKIRNPDGTFHVGAISRLAERLGRSHNTVHSWMSGEREPRLPGDLEQIDRIAKERLSLGAKPMGFPKGKKTWFRKGNRRVYVSA